MLPENYDRVELERELQELRTLISNFQNIIPLIARENPPPVPVQGMLSYSDGSSDWGPGAAEGVYRYTGAAWVLVG